MASRPSKMGCQSSKCFGRSAKERLETPIQNRQTNESIEPNAPDAATTSAIDIDNIDNHDLSNHEEPEPQLQSEVVNPSIERHIQQVGITPRTDSKATDFTNTTKYSELSFGPPTRAGRRIQNISFTLCDNKGEEHGVTAKLDNGVGNSFISPRTVKLHGLIPRPLQDIHLLRSPLDGCKEVPVNCYVEVTIKCKELNLGRETVKLGILEAEDRWGILIGENLILRYGLFKEMHKLAEEMGDDGSFGTLIDSRSEGT